jgi:predicted esterase
MDTLAARRLCLASMLILTACSTQDAPASDAGATPEAGDPSEDAGPSDAGPLRVDPLIPAVTGPCGDFTTSGTVTLAGPSGTTRTAQIWVSSAAATLDGPLVFFWHGVGGSPDEAPAVLGPALDEILAAGGIVVGLTHDPAAGDFPWYLTAGSRQDDLVFADEAVACAASTIGIDTHRIHSIGFSAGALHVGQMAFLRASYLASVVTYSGGLIARSAPALDAPDARTSAMALFGGVDDRVVISFATATRNFSSALQRGGHFVVVCDHGLGHTVPRAAIPFAWQFLTDHPYGVQPPAYRDGLPAGFYAPCALP